MKLVVTIDTEADNQWNHGCPISTENVRFWAPFQALYQRHGLFPTYLGTLGQFFGLVRGYWREGATLTEAAGLLEATWSPEAETEERLSRTR
jgi:hypothetical protein